MRNYKSGATRSDDTGKIDYFHRSESADRVYCEYMYKHTIQEDGKMRSPDNFKKGMEMDNCRKSLLGHTKDLRMLLEGNKVTENGELVTPFEAMMGMMFNLTTFTAELMRDYTFDRKYTDGKMAEDFNERFNNIYPKHLK